MKRCGIPTNGTLYEASMFPTGVLQQDVLQRKIPLGLSFMQARFSCPLSRVICDGVT